MSKFSLTSQTQIPTFHNNHVKIKADEMLRIHLSHKLLSIQLKVSHSSTETEVAQIQELEFATCSDMSSLSKPNYPIFLIPPNTALNQAMAEPQSGH